MIIDLRDKLRECKKGTVVITSKGYKFKLVSRENNKEEWLDLESNLIWGDVEPGKYTYAESIERFGSNLPTREQFEEVEERGFIEVMSDFKDRWFWSSSVHPFDASLAYFFYGSFGYVDVDDRSSLGSVRCVRAAAKGKKVKK